MRGTSNRPESAHVVVDGVGIAEMPGEPFGHVTEGQRVPADGLDLGQQHRDAVVVAQRHTLQAQGLLG